MVRAYISVKSARVILALLLFGSMSGFVIGQELHHPAAPIARAPSVVTAHAAGSLGVSSPITSHSVKNVVTPTSHRSAPRDEHAHDAHHHHKGEDTASFTQLILVPIAPQQHDHGGSGGGSGGD